MAVRAPVSCKCRLADAQAGARGCKGTTKADILLRVKYRSKTKGVR